MRSQLAALVERLVPRLVSALLIFGLAAFTDPTSVGVYSAGILAYTAVQAVTESAVRQLLPRAVNDSPRFIAAYCRVAPAVSAAAIVAAIVGLAMLSDPAAVGLAPLALAPLATTWGLPAVGHLQKAHRWRELASGQLVAAIAAASVTVPLLIMTQSIVAASLQVLLAEAVNSIWCRWNLRRLTTSPDRQSRRSGNDAVERETRRSFFAMVRYSSLAWTQGQLDRVVLGTLAGASALGAFSIASALARSIGDPLAASTANMLRSKLSSSDPDDMRGIRSIAQSVTLRAMALALVSFCFGVAGAIVAARVLGSEWQEAIAITPILAISCLPSALNWSGSALQVAVGRAHRAIWAPVVGIVIAPLVGVAAAFIGLESAAWLVLVRELAVLTTAYAMVRRYAPWKSYVLCVAACAVLAGLMQTPPLRALVGL